MVCHALLVQGIPAGVVLGLGAAFASGSDGTAWTNADEVRSIVAQMLADAGTRSSLANDAGAAGYDGRFFIAGTDGTFRLSFGGEVQFRYWGNFDADQPSGDGYRGGFQTDRTRLEFRGNVVSPRLRYRVLGNFNKSGGAFDLLDAYAEHEIAEGLRVRWGQFKLPFDREFFATTPTEVLTIDRSVVAAVFGLGRSEGVQVGYEADRWRAYGAFSAGRRALDSDFDSSVEADAAFTGRAEFRIGEAGWKQLHDQSSFRGGELGALIGIGGHWQQEGSTGTPASASGTPNLFSYTADIGVDGDGWNVMGSIVGRTIDTDDSLLDWGFVVQGGAFVTGNAEVFARYSQIIPDDDRSHGDEFRAVTFGFNWFFIPGSHAATLTTEIIWYPDTQADSSAIVSPNSSIGLLADDSGGQFAAGLQMQIVF